MLDPNEPGVDLTQFPIEHWSATPYGLFKEGNPSNAPAPRSTGFTMRAFVDSNHAGESIACHSRTSFIVILNNAPVFVSSKKRGSCETSSFGYEFIEMKS